ncbi:hypothetical protein CDG77_10180 [Nostoc sp. 'Peltigera membranacea cyanobiont' 213]|nr:hypothetical protein CDG77_10180 [Nostoc sp. 'Peltigera membranacea cyanobiont' 213]
MQYLLFGRKDKVNGCPVISQHQVAKAEGKLEIAKESTNYNAAKFLLSFQSIVMGEDAFQWSAWSFKEGLARTALVKFTPEVEQALELERYNFMNTETRVYFETGDKYSPRLEKLSRDLIKAEANTYLDLCAPEARELAEYLNDLPVNSFTKVIEANLNETLVKAFNIEDPELSRLQVEILATIRDVLKPFYKGSDKGKTVRIFPFNYSIPMLTKGLRKTLTKGWVEFDLTSCQLAIAAKMWEIEEIQEFLRSGESIWISLINHYGLDGLNMKYNDNPRYELIKEDLKDSLYSLMYGMVKKNLIADLTEDLERFGIVDGGKTYMTHPIIKILYQSREQRMKELNDYDSVQTVFGKVIHLRGSKLSDGSPDDLRKEYIRSVMAQQAQAIELYLMLPVLDLAKTTKDFIITIFQHDGCSINFTNKSKKKKWLTRIVGAVQARADELGILTGLEYVEL